MLYDTEHAYLYITHNNSIRLMNTFIICLLAYLYYIIIVYIYCLFMYICSLMYVKCFTRTYTSHNNKWDF